MKGVLYLAATLLVTFLRPEFGAVERETFPEESVPSFVNDLDS